MNTIDSITAKIEKYFAGEYSGHDFWHTLRVYRNACMIAETEDCDKEIVAIASLLHDVDDVKLYHTENYAAARKIMTEEGIAADIQERVIEIISTISFKGADTVTPASIEGKIVQDADRLDALGAVGIARTFAYGGCKGRYLYDPAEKPRENMSEEEYRENKGTSINHFYEKLFLIKDMMNTETAQKIAKKRDAFMHEFIDEFFEEWNGK
ncbi:MAG TPA: HD domain-containing protein [Methanocorpusculum sp.]|nr:HD domain-containing protein [Methanocorpusculum sp.]